MDNGRRQIAAPTHIGVRKYLHRTERGDRIMTTRITYDEYKRLGYSAIPEDQKEQFERFVVMARQAVKKFSNHRFSADLLDDNILRGIFEICEVYFLESQNDNRLAAFANDGYREQYFANADLNKRVFELIQLYFPKDWLFRGVQ